MAQFQVESVTRSTPSAFGACPNSWIVSAGKHEASFQARVLATEETAVVCELLRHDGELQSLWAVSLTKFFFFFG